MEKPYEIYARYESEVRPFVACNDFARAIGVLESALSREPASAFQGILGRSWLSEREACAKWLREVVSGASKAIELKAIYCEMNRFEINTDQWSIDAFCYATVGNPLSNWDWICGWTYSAPDPFVLRGFEFLQAEFERYFGGTPRPPAALATSAQLTILLVSTRMQELVFAAVEMARRNRWLPADLPVLSAVHETDVFSVSGDLPA